MIGRQSLSARLAMRVGAIGHASTVAAQGRGEGSSKFFVGADSTPVSVVCLQIEAQPAAPPRIQLFGIAGAALATMAWGASGVIAKGISMGGLALVAYRFSMAAIVFIVFAAVARPTERMTMQVMRWCMPAGLALAADTALFFSAVKETTVANATVIGALQPVIMLAVAHRLLGERILRTQVVWSIVAVAGAAFLIFGSSGLPGWSLLGDGLAVGALLFWTLYLFLVKRLLTDTDVTTLQLTTAVAIYTGFSMIPISLLFGQDLSLPSTRDLLLLMVMAFGSGLLAHPLMNWALARIPVTIGSAMMLLVPVSASLLAWAFLDERLRLAQLAGAFVVLVALCFLTAIATSTNDDVDP